MFGRSLTLPDQADSRAADLVRAELLQALEAGEGVQLEASHVERMSTAMLQVLLSAKASFARAGLAFDITAPSEVFSRAVRDAALDPTLQTTHDEEA